MSVNNKLLREGIISKLKDYDAYVDNELPDYIMVMLANNKTVHQVNNDLQLFLGANTDRFTKWLQRAMSDPSILTETSSENKKEREGDSAEKEEGGPSSTLAGSKRKRSDNLKQEEGEEEEGEVELEDYEEDDWDDDLPPTPPLEEVAATMAKAEQKRQRERERGRGKERGGSPVKVVKISTDDASNVIVKKVIRVLHPPDSSRDQDLRDLIAQRRKDKAHQQQLVVQRRERGDRGEEKSDGEGDSSGHTASIPSVVKLVQVPERPHRSDKGGSRLLHKAILGIKSDGGKRSSRGHERSSSGSGKERVDQDLSTRNRERASRSSKHLTSEPIQSSDQDHDDVIAGGESSEEVLVEVAEEGAMTEGASFVDEFRQEQQMEKTKDKISKDAIERSTLAAVQKVLPLGKRLRLSDVRSTKNSKVKRLSAMARLGERKEEGGGGGGGERSEESEAEVDLREIINRKNKKNTESSTRFVVTLAGAGEEYTNNSTSDLDEEESTQQEATKEMQKTLLSRNRRFNRQAVVETEAVSRNVTEIAGEEEEEEEDVYEEDRQGGRGLSGLPERCRFWPNCKNGDSCPFHHPSVACRLFPNCKYGNKCHFIHPQCKFDARCTRADCPYLHTAPRHLGFNSPLMAPPTAPPTMIPQPVFSPFNSSFTYSRASPWQQTRPQRYPNKSALSWTPGKMSHISERQFAVSDDQTSSLPV